MKVLVLIFSFLSVSAFAQVGKPNVCAEDVGRLCAGKLTQTEVAACVAENKDKLTGECRKLIFGAEDNARAVHNNCRADAKKYCAKIATNEGILFDCLVKYRKNLSVACKKSLDKIVK